MEVDKSVRRPFEHFHDRTDIVDSLKRKQHYASETIVFKTTRRLLDTEIKQQGATTGFYLTGASFSRTSLPNWARYHPYKHDTTVFGSARNRTRHMPGDRYVRPTHVSQPLQA